MSSTEMMQVRMLHNHDSSCEKLCSVAHLHVLISVVTI